MKRWQFWLGVLISGVFLYLVVRKLDWVSFWMTLKTANYWWIIPGVAVYFVAVWVRAWRWHYLLKPIKSIPTRKMFPITCIGYMGNNIYPARAGEVLRAVVLKRREGVPDFRLPGNHHRRAYLRRGGDAGLCFCQPNPTGKSGRCVRPVGKWQITIQDLAIWGSVAFFGALLIFLLAAMFPEVTNRLGQWFIDHLLPASFAMRSSGIMHKFMDGLESLRSPANVLMVFLTSIVIWLLETVKYWFVMHAFGLEHRSVFSS